MIHPRQSVAGFLPWKWGEMLLDFHHGNLEPIPNTLRKHQSRPHPFRNQTSKPNSFKVSRANANSSFLIANVRKLRFYQNKILSLDRRCGVHNTFSTCNQTSKLKNQDFFPMHIRLGKMNWRGLKFQNELERIEIHTAARWHVHMCCLHNLFYYYVYQICIDKKWNNSKVECNCKIVEANRLFNFWKYEDLMEYIGIYL